MTSVALHVEQLVMYMPAQNMPANASAEMQCKMAALLHPMVRRVATWPAKVTQLRCVAALTVLRSSAFLRATKVLSLQHCLHL
jgi:hypothetical protein